MQTKVEGTPESLVSRTVCSRPRLSCPHVQPLWAASQTDSQAGRGAADALPIALHTTLSPVLCGS